jgi:hypothetical protein
MGVGVIPWTPTNELFAGEPRWVDGSEIARITAPGRMSVADKLAEGYAADRRRLRPLDAHRLRRILGRPPTPQGTHRRRHGDMVSEPARALTMAPVPPQNLDAEESVLGAMMLSAARDRRGLRINHAESRRLLPREPRPHLPSRSSPSTRKANRSTRSPSSTNSTATNARSRQAAPTASTSSHRSSPQPQRTPPTTPASSSTWQPCARSSGQATTSHGSASTGPETRLEPRQPRPRHHRTIADLGATRPQAALARAGAHRTRSPKPPNTSTASSKPASSPTSSASPTSTSPPPRSSSPSRSRKDAASSSANTRSSSRPKSPTSGPTTHAPKN